MRLLGDSQVDYELISVADANRSIMTAALAELYLSSHVKVQPPIEVIETLILSILKLIRNPKRRNNDRSWVFKVIDIN